MKSISKAALTGVATVMIRGLAVGMFSVVIPLAVVAFVILGASHFAGLYGVGIAAVGMLATVGITMSIDAYGPIADNAGGIAEMAGMGKETRAITDTLDEVGNTTAAIGKGFAIGAAAFAALALIAAFINVVKMNNPGFQLLISDPRVLTGLFIGGFIPFLVSALSMTAVGEAAQEMIEEIRRQFREIPGLLEGTGKPDPASCIRIATDAAIKRMILPASVAVGSPAVIGFGLGATALGGALIGALLSGVLLASFHGQLGRCLGQCEKIYRARALRRQEFGCAQSLCGRGHGR